MRLFSLLLAASMIFGGCGYSLEMSSVEEVPEAPDPMTLLGRDIRQLKADHRVSIFDLKNEQKLLEEKRKADVKKQLAGLRIQIQRDLRAMETKREADLLSLRRNDANFGEKIADIEFQLRVMGGSIEEEINRYRDASEQTNNNSMRELGNLKRLLADEGKEKAASLKGLQNQIAREKQHRKGLKKTFDEVLLAQANAEKKAREALQSQIDQIKSSNLAAGTSSDQQIKALSEVTAQVDQLFEKLLPAVNRLSERLDKQEDQFDTLRREVDVDALNRQLTALTKTIDVQRKSLEMLGNTLTSEIDKQKRLLQQTMKSLQALQKK